MPRMALYYSQHLNEELEMIPTEVEASNDIEWLRELCIERGMIITKLKKEIAKLEDVLRIAKEDLDSCYASN